MWCSLIIRNKWSISTQVEALASENGLRCVQSFVRSYMTLYECASTVEPPIKDLLNKGHLSIKDTCLSPILILWCIILPLNKGHLFIEDTLNDPNVSFIRRFHCIMCNYVYTGYWGHSHCP